MIEELEKFQKMYDIWVTIADVNQKTRLLEWLAHLLKEDINKPIRDRMLESAGKSK